MNLTSHNSSPFSKVEKKLKHLEREGQMMCRPRKSFFYRKGLPSFLIRGFCVGKFCFRIFRFGSWLWLRLSWFPWKDVPCCGATHDADDDGGKQVPQRQLPSRCPTIPAGRSKSPSTTCPDS